MTKKIDIHNIAGSFDNLKARIKRDMSEHNYQIIDKFAADCQIGYIGKTVGKHRLVRYLYDLHRISLYFKNKSFDRLTQDDFKQFYTALKNDTIRRIDNNQAYSISSKQEFVKTLQKFYRWLWKDGEKFKQNVGWMKKDFGKSGDPEKALTREEVETMAENFDIKRKTLLLFLFDSGCRAEELLNVRISHLIKEDNKDYYKVRIEHSKTLPRTITLPIVSKYIGLYLGQHPEKDNPNAQLFPLTYHGLCCALSDMGKKILNRHIHPHLLRHSSATYYANQIKNPYKLNYRFGWATASDMAQQYIDREGLLDEETVDIVKVDEVERLKKEIEKINEYLAIRKDADKIMTLLMEDAEIQRTLLKRIKDKDLVKRVRMML